MDPSLRVKQLLSEPSTDASNDVSRRARVERTGVELFRQGAAVAETLADAQEGLSELARRIAARSIRRVVIVGCGDSWFVGIGARLAFERLTGWPTEPAQAFDWAHYASATADEATLVIGLSSGGNTPAVMAALDNARKGGAFTVGTSNTAGSPVLTRFDGALLVRATRAGWPTQSSTAALALLCRLAIEIARARGAPGSVDPEAMLAELAALPATMDSAVQSFDGEARALAKRWARTRFIMFTGAGPHFAAAAFGAAKVKELGPIHAFAMPLEEYHHYRSQKAGDPLFLVAPDQESRERSLDTALVSRHVGGRTVALLGREDAEIAGCVEATWQLPPVRAELACLIHSLPLHLFAFHFARVRFEQGLGYPPALDVNEAA